MSEELPILVLGGGGHAKVLIDTLNQSENNILGILDNSLSVNTSVLNIPVIGDDTKLLDYKKNEVKIVIGVGSLPSTRHRQELINYVAKLGYKITTVVHPSAVIASEIILPEGAQVMAGVIIQPGVKIGKYSILNSRSLIEHDCIIGSNCHLAPGSILCGGVTVGDESHIGAGAIVLQNVNIGTRVTVGAGALVLYDIVSSKKVVGVPAREI